jgi:hypothetical protein
MKNGLDGKDGINGQDGRPGMDADENKIIKEVLDKVKEFNLEIEDINGLKEALERLETVRRMGGGGGTSYMAIKQHFVNDETPVNSGDDLNFTISQAPNPTNSLKLYRNGQRLKVGATNDYTFSGKTITLLTALIASEILTCDYQA